MTKRLYITPPSLLRWQPEGDRSDVLLLDLEPDFPDEHTIRLDLNVVFRPIPVRRGWPQSRDYYVGTTGARVVFQTNDGIIGEHTPGMTLEINYSNTYTRSRQASVKLAPKVEVAAAVGVELSEVGFDKHAKQSFTTNFKSAERTLADINLNNGVEWEIAVPKQAIRDYLIGNLYLVVECSWEHGTKWGTIELRPSDVLFFDSERRAIADGPSALLMQFLLYRRGIKINREGLKIRFEERSDE